MSFFNRMISHKDLLSIQRDSRIPILGLRRGYGVRVICEAIEGWVGMRR